MWSYGGNSNLLILSSKKKLLNLSYFIDNVLGKKKKKDSKGMKCRVLTF